MKLQKRYANRDKQVYEWITDIITNLEKELGEIPQGQICQLDLLCDAFEMYNNAKAEIARDGLSIKTSKGLVKHPSTSILNSSQLFITRLLSQFALTRVAKSRLKESLDEDDSPIAEYM